MTTTLYDRNFMTRYALMPDPQTNALLTATLQELHNTTAVERFLAAYAPLIKAKEPAVAATYLCAYFGSLAVAVQYMLSIGNGLPNLEPDEIQIQLVQDGAYGQIYFTLLNAEEQLAPSQYMERKEWVIEQLTRFYRDAARPFIDAVAHCAGIDAGQLWGQFPTRFNYHIEHWPQEDEAVKQRVEQDYDNLKRSLDPVDVFGRNKNPFDVKVRWIEDLKDNSKQVRMKNACCLYHKTENGAYCYTCPKLKEAERNSRRELARKTT